MPVERFISPRKGPVGWMQNGLANAAGLARLRRTVTARMPFPVLQSDVRDIVYANWIVPTAAVADFVPPGMTVLQRGGTTILTVLTYSHGHFGPAALGPLRRVFPSPLQSNWRLYVDTIDGAAPARPTVLFLANLFDSALYALGTRMLSDVMHAHQAVWFEHRCGGDGWISRAGGGGSAPSWRLQGREATAACLPPGFAGFFPDYAASLRGLCLQEAAVAAVERPDALAIAEIALPIDVNTIVPLTVDDYRPGELLMKLGATETPFCFRVPAVAFTILSERLIDLG